MVPAIITKAFEVQLPWKNARCAVRVERLTGAALVATTDEYNAAFLYSIYLGREVDSGGLFSLSDRQAEVSFKLCKKWRTEAARDVPRDAAAGGPASLLLYLEEFSLVTWQQTWRCLAETAKTTANQPAERNTSR